jgi:hypothetical protein
MIMSPLNVLRKCHPLKEMVTLNRKEQGRLLVLNQMEVRQIIGIELAELFDLSLHDVRRTLPPYRKEGAQALAHGHQG